MAKTDLKLFGEIDKRVAQLSPCAKDVLVAGLAAEVVGAEFALMQQIRERYVDLSEKGREYVDGQLGVERPDLKKN